MYVCVCKGVTTRQIVQAAAEGVTRMRELRCKLGVTTECNLCAQCAHQCLRSALAEQTPQQAAKRPRFHAPASQAAIALEVS